MGEHMEYTLRELMNLVSTTMTEIDGEWVPTRPLRNRTLMQRLKAAWNVFIGKSDSFTWPKGQ